MRLLSELLGTFLLVLVGPGTVATVALVGGIPSFEAFLIIGFAFGAIVALLILFLGRISGAHIDPAITLGHAIAGKTERAMLAPYIVFQVIGALLGGYTLRLIFTPYGLPADLGTTKLASGISVPAGIFLEMMGTFFLAMSGFIASSRIHSKPAEALLIGVTLFIIIIVLGPLTSASLNPARSVGPAVASGYLTNLFVYWIGPPAGGSMAGLVVRLSERRRVG
jgi:MIP family channel proteins